MKLVLIIDDTVMQTSSTEIESPSRVPSNTLLHEITIVSPRSDCPIRSTRPISSTMPLNTMRLLQIGDPPLDTQVIAELRHHPDNDPRRCGHRRDPTTANR